MSDSGKPKCGTCSTDPVVAATDPCATETECTVPVDPCEEDHTEVITECKFATTLKVLNTFNFPAVGEYASLTLEGVTSMLPGSLLWNPTVGKLYIESFDATTGIAVVTNKGDSCDAGAKTPGDAVPACTEFALGIPECNTGGVGNNSDVLPYLDADFIAPALDACQLASVTNVTGISVNDIVSINTFLYRVKSIPDAGTLELCNEGDGAPTGQVIEWDPNCDEVPDVQVISVSSDDPCSRDGINSGVILVCDGGVAQPLVGTNDSQIPIWDDVLKKFVLRTVSLPESCTALTSCLLVEAGSDGPYLTIVTTTSIFEEGINVVIDDDVFEVTEIVSPTLIRLTPAITPPLTKGYEIGETVCVQDCCAYLPARVTEIEETINDPCYPAQLHKVRVHTFNSSALPFAINEEAPGDYQQYYDIGDPALPAEFFRETFTLPPSSPELDGCKYYVLAEAKINVTSIATQDGVTTPAAIKAVRMVHDLVLGVNGDDTNLFSRGIGSFKGTNQEDDAVAAGAPAPAGFFHENYGWFDTKTLTFCRDIEVVIGTDPDPEFFIGHRLALSRKAVINAVSWGGGNNERIEFSLNGFVRIRAWRVFDI